MARANVKDKRRQQLIEANIGSIAKRGYAETTIAHVSEGAGMSRGIVNFYFTSKENMMQETLRYLLEGYAQNIAAHLADKTASPAEDRLLSLVEANFDTQVLSSKRLNVWSAFWGHASTHKAYAKLIEACDEAHISRIAELWEEVCESHGQKKRGNTHFPQQLHAMIRGMWLMLLIEPSLYDSKSLLSFCLRAVQEKIEQLGGVVKPEKIVQLADEDKKSAKKPAKPHKGDRLPGQLDFEDLFAAKQS